MKTVVETYIIEETKELIYDNDKLESWNKHVEALGLVGQSKIVAGEKSPIPFLWMNTALINVISELCPTKKAIEVYDKIPIPVEILDIVALSVREGHFDKIEVWYNEANPDPAVVGFKYKDGETASWAKEYYASKYLMARWSDIKQSIQQLTERAKKVFVARRTNELKASIKMAQRELEDLELERDSHFGLKDSIPGDLAF